VTANFGRIAGIFLGNAARLIGSPSKSNGFWSGHRRAPAQQVHTGALESGSRQPGARRRCTTTRLPVGIDVIPPAFL